MLACRYTFLPVQAPEVIMRRGTTKAADYWALGVLIFEMLVGDPPFKSLSGDPWDTFRRTLSGRFYIPNFISESASSLICQLLQVTYKGLTLVALCHAIHIWTCIACAMHCRCTHVYAGVHLHVQHVCVMSGKVPTSLFQLIGPVFCNGHAMLICHLCLLQLTAPQIVTSDEALPFQPVAPTSRLPLDEGFVEVDAA